MALLNLLKLTNCAIFVLMYFSKIILNDLIEFASSKGADRQEIEQKLLSVPIAEKNIDYERMVESLNFVGQALKDDNLGLHIGEQISLKVTNYVDSIMQYSPTLEIAFENAIKYSKLISDALECHLIKKDNHYHIEFVESPDWKIQQSQARTHVLTLTVISTLKSIVAYTNKKYFPVKINFHFDRPKNITEYYKLFNCSVHFNQPTTEVVFEKYIFKNSQKKTDIELLENLKEKVEQEIQRLEVEDETVYQLKKCILNHKPERIKIEEAVLLLNTSKRTLQRKLTKLVSSFKKVEYEIQLRLSKTYLEEGIKTIDEISYLLGFSESSSFIRFFKGQTGATPKQYRDSS